MAETRWDDIELQYTEPCPEYVQMELEKFDKHLEEFCKTSGIAPERIEVNVKALKEVVVRLDMRRLYFIIYHKGMAANEFKINTGLTVFWILKLRPFWMRIKEEDSSEQIETATWINERICVYFVVSLMREYNKDFFSYGKDLVKAYTHELEYSFRYRDLSKESMFLMFDPFYYLYFYNQSTKDGGKKIL